MKLLHTSIHVNIHINKYPYNSNPIHPQKLIKPIHVIYPNFTRVHLYTPIVTTFINFHHATCKFHHRNFKSSNIQIYQTPRTRTGTLSTESTHLGTRLKLFIYIHHIYQNLVEGTTTRICTYINDPRSYQTYKRQHPLLISQIKDLNKLV